MTWYDNPLLFCFTCEQIKDMTISDFIGKDFDELREMLYNGCDVE